MNKINDLKFKVLGAGFISISNSHDWETGPIQKDTHKRINGFGFEVDWDGHGFTGGVLPDKEARTLAEHILKVLNNE